MLNNGTLTYPHAVVKSFGYTDYYVDNVHKEMKSLDQKKLFVLSNNSEHRCICCGNIYPYGIQGEVTKRLFTTTFNESYTLSKPLNKNGIEYICGCCLYAFKNYQEMRMQNVVIYQDGTHEHFIIRNNTENGMYDLIFNPKSLPYIMFVNTGGKVLEFLVHLAVPTISKKIVTIVFGTQVMYVDTVLLRECLDETLELIELFKFHKTTLLNAQSNDVGSMRYANMQQRDWSDDAKTRLFKFHLKYDKETRVLTDKLLEKHKFEIKK